MTFLDIVATEKEVPNIVANLDIEDNDCREIFDEDESGETASQKKATAEPDGVQQKYVCRLQKQIQRELSKDFPALGNRWLKTDLDKID